MTSIYIYSMQRHIHLKRQKKKNKKAQNKCFLGFEFPVCCCMLLAACLAFLSCSFACLFAFSLSQWFGEPCPVTEHKPGLRLDSGGPRNAFLQLQAKRCPAADSFGKIKAPRPKSSAWKLCLGTDVTFAQTQASCKHSAPSLALTKFF